MVDPVLFFFVNIFQELLQLLSAPGDGEALPPELPPLERKFQAMQPPKGAAQ